MIHSKTRALAGVMLRSGSSYREVSDALEISVGSVHNISREEIDYLQPLVMEMKRRSAFKCYLLADHTLSRMSDADFDRADLKQKSIAAGILFDKATMLDGIMPLPDRDAWDKSIPGQIGKMFRPEGDDPGTQAMNRRRLVMSLFMKGQDEEAHRIGQMMKMTDEEIEANSQWQREFDPPTTRQESRRWKQMGVLREDFDDSALPEGDEVKEQDAREAQAVRMERMRMVFIEACGVDVGNTMGAGDAVDVTNVPEDDGVVEIEAQAAPAIAGGHDGALKLGMQKAMDRVLPDEIKANTKLNRIEQAVQAQLDEKYGKIPGAAEEN